jgi:hypothetical protein
VGAKRYQRRFFCIPLKPSLGKVGFHGRFEQLDPDQQQHEQAEDVHEAVLN